MADENPIALTIDALGLFPSLGEGGRIVARADEPEREVRASVQGTIEELASRGRRAVFCVDDHDSPTVLMVANCC